MKRPSPEPTLLEEALEAEHRRHASRITELKRAGARLRMLQEFAPALQQRGIKLYGEHILCAGERALTVTNESMSWRLADALIELGFEEVERDAYPSFSVLHLKKGRLQLRVYVSGQRPAPKPEPIPVGEAIESDFGELERAAA
jgi:hypothetical protein